MKKIPCGSAVLFKDIAGFIPNDRDYILITNRQETYVHEHPEPNVCHFVWGKDKESVRKHVRDLHFYMLATSLVTKPFVDHYGFTHEDIEKTIKGFYKAYQESKYAYYLPLFDYILTYHSWDFPKEVIDESYKIYVEKKKKV